MRYSIEQLNAMPVGTVLFHDGTGELVVPRPFARAYIKTDGVLHPSGYQWTVNEGSFVRWLNADTLAAMDFTHRADPQPAPSMAQRIDAAVLTLLPEGPDRLTLIRAIRAAAAVPHTIEIGVRGFAPTDYYNAGQNSILAPILAALTGDTHEQR